MLKRLIFATGVGKDPSEFAGRRPLSHFAPSEIPSTQEEPGSGRTSGLKWATAVWLSWARLCKKLLLIAIDEVVAVKVDANYLMDSDLACRWAIFQIFRSTRKHTDGFLMSV